MKKKKRKPAGTRRGNRAGHRTGSPPSLKTDAANSHGSAPSAFTHGHSFITGAGKYGQTNLWPILALSLLVLVSYIPALSGGFIWDDVGWTPVQVIKDWSGIWDLWFTHTYGVNGLKNEGHYWPLLYISLWLDNKLWGMEPMGYHATNILFHLVNSVLLWKLLQRLAIPGAWLIAAVFAVHPLNVEPVAWVIGRKDLLAALFYFAALLTWLRFAEKQHLGTYILTLALYVGGLLSKSSGITLPVTLLIIQWWKHGQIGRQDWLRVTPFFVIGLGMGLADIAFYHARLGDGGSFDYSMIERVMIAAHALWFYVGKLMWPTELSVVYPHWQISVADPWGWVFVIAAAVLVAALWLLRHRIGRGPLAGVLFFAVTLSPVLGFVDYSYMEFSFVADRYQYLAGIGVLAVIIGGTTHGLVTACQAGRLPREIIKPGQAVVVAILGVLGTLTWQQAGIYRDNITFWTHVTSLNPNAWFAHRNLGSELFRQERLEEALTATNTALTLRPDESGLYVNLGAIYNKMEQPEEAEKHTRRALEINPRILIAHRNLGTSLFKQERLEEGLTAIKTALTSYPDDPPLYITLGLIYKKMEHLNEAEKQFRHALKLDPYYQEPYKELVLLQFDQQRYEEMLELTQTQISIIPDSVTAWSNKGVALFNMGRLKEAKKSFEQALALDPHHETSQTNLDIIEQNPGEALLKQGRTEESLAITRTLLAKRPNDPELYITLGKIHNRMGKPDEAEKYFRRAIELDPRNSLDAYTGLADPWIKQQRYDEVLTLLQSHVELVPDNSDAWSNLGVAFFHIGNLEEAKKNFDRALELDPDNETARANHGQVLKAIQARSPGNE